MPAALEFALAVRAATGVESRIYCCCDYGYRASDILLNAFRIAPQVVRSLARFARSGEDRSFVIAQERYPILDVAGVPQLALQRQCQGRNAGDAGTVVRSMKGADAAMRQRKKYRRLDNWGSCGRVCGRGTCAVYRRSGQRRELWYTRAISIVVPRTR